MLRNTLFFATISINERRIAVKNAIPYTNKDILFKVLERHYEDKSLAVYGLDIPKIRRMLPTNYPSISATEIHADSPFLLEDGSLYLQEYESTVEPQDGLKYAKYICAACDFLQKEGIRISNVIVGIIYTGDIESASDTYDFGALRVQVRQVFLSKFDSDAMRADLINKFEQNHERHGQYPNFAAYRAYSQRA